MAFNRKIAVLAVMAGAVLFYSACGSSAKSNDEALYSLKLEKTAEIIASHAYACSSQLSSYWAIWEYAKASEIDFETAAQQMQGGQTTQNLSMMQENKAQIDRLLADLESPPEKYAEAFQKLQDLYAAYVQMHSQALKPSGDWEYLEQRIRTMEDNVHTRKSELDAELSAVSQEQ